MIFTVFTLRNRGFTSVYTFDDLLTPQTSRMDVDTPREREQILCKLQRNYHQISKYFLIFSAVWLESQLSHVGEFIYRITVCKLAKCWGNITFPKSNNFLQPH